MFWTPILKIVSHQNRSEKNYSSYKHGKWEAAVRHLPSYCHIEYIIQREVIIVEN